MQFSPVDKLLVSCCGFGMAMVWNLVDYQCIRTLQVCAVLGDRHRTALCCPLLA